MKIVKISKDSWSRDSADVLLMMSLEASCMCNEYVDCANKINILSPQSSLLLYAVLM